MDAELRTQKIQEVIGQDNPIGTKRVAYKKDIKDMKAYEIPVDYLIFNQYNGRIGTFVKTYEKQNGPIDTTTTDGEKLIFDFLWESKETRNKETLNDIKLKGQLEVGIITKDGVIIDGNRRCMLLKKIAKDGHDNPTYFRAVVLDDKLEDNPKEIRKLETIYQMGVDQPVDYNPIEKYLKCKDLSHEDEFTNEEIAKMMGEKPSSIKKYLNILTLMETYLQSYGYEGMYTRLEEESVEGPFDYLVGYLETQKTGSRIQGRDWSPDIDDLDDLKNIYFDYIRAGLRTSDGLRFIGNPSRSIDKQGFFNKKDIWIDFVSEHESEINVISDEEKTIDDLRSERPNEDITDIMKSRDADWKNKVVPSMKENLGKSRRKLDDMNEANAPMALLQRAKNTLEAINTDSSEFDESVLIMVKEINSILWGFQQIIKKKNK